MRRMQHVDKHPKSGIYRVRYTYPRHLHGVLKAAGVTQSLGTRSGTEAKKKAVPILAQIERRVADAEAIHRAAQTGEEPQVSLTLPEGIRIVEAWLNAYLRRLQRVLTQSDETLAGDYLAVSDDPASDRAILQADPDLMVRLYYANEPIPFDIQNRTLNRLLGSAGFVLPERHRLRTALLGPLRAAIDTIRRRENEWRAADWTNRLPDEAPAASLPAPTLVPLAPVPDIGPSPQITTGKRLKELLKIYVEKMQPKSPREQELAVRLLCRFLGDDDPLIETITPEQADSFYDMLKCLPKSMTSALSQRPILDVVSDMKSGKLNVPQTSPATAFKKLTLLNAMFSYAAARNLMRTPNPFSRVAGPKDKQPQVKRRPMCPEDLKSIFSAPLFRGCADYNNWRNDGGVLIANHRFWLPLLGMATGCRLEEIGQLLLSDVHVSGGIIFLKITEEIEEKDAGIGAKSVKTSKSNRRIPVHQLVIDAGFQEYCDWLRARGEKRLFPELPNTGKKTKRFSQWFNRDFRPTVGLEGPERPFHSFRHLFKDRCREAELERDIHDALTGHADGAVGTRYGDGHSIERLKAAMDRITFPGFPGVPSRSGPYEHLPGYGIVIDGEAAALPVLSDSDTNQGI